MDGFKPIGIGVIMQKDLQGAGALEVGQELSINVIDPEMDEGYALLSMKERKKTRMDELQRVYDNSESFKLHHMMLIAVVYWLSLKVYEDFLPVSQLAAGHYPRVVGADKDEILQKLNQLSNKPISVKIIDISRKDNKLIFSEKEAVKDNMQDRFAKLKVGDLVEGVVTGVMILVLL